MEDRLIMLAEDDPDDSLIFEEALKEIDGKAQIRVAINGVQLIKLLIDIYPRLPDVIFLDLNMPMKNGFECLSEIRASANLNRIPIIILSTSGNKDSIEKVFKLGANYYIRKPGTFDELKSFLNKILSIEWDNYQAATSIQNFIIN